MKKTLIQGLLMAVFMLAAGAATAQSYALHYVNSDGAALSDGDTVLFTPEDWELEIGLAQINFYVENLTDDNLLTDQRVEVLSGPSGMTVDICAGGSCPVPPALPAPYTVQAHTTLMDPITLKVHLSPTYSGEALIKLTVGRSPSLGDGLTVYVKATLGSQNGVVAPTAAKRPVAYPNPTTGKVRVDGLEFDLGDRPAGVYMLPAGNGTVRVIKL